MRIILLTLFLISFGCNAHTKDTPPILPTNKTNGRITFKRNVKVAGLTVADFKTKGDLWFKANDKNRNALNVITDNQIIGKCDFFKHNAIKDEKGVAHSVDIEVSYQVSIIFNKPDVQISLTNFTGTQKGSSLGAPIEGMYKALKIYATKKPDNLNTQVQQMLISVLKDVDVKANETLNSISKSYLTLNN